MSTASISLVRGQTPARAAVIALACCASVTLVVNIFLNVPQHDPLLAVDTFVLGIDVVSTIAVFALAAWAWESPGRTRGLAVAVLVLSVLALPAYWLVMHPVFGVATLLLADRLPDHPTLARVSRVAGWLDLAVGAAFAVGAVVQYLR